MEIRVPEFGESILEGTINHWLKKQGDFISLGEAVVEIETEKINVEVTAEQSGILQKIIKDAGEVVKVGEVIAIMQQGSEQEPAAIDMPNSQEQTTAPQVMQPIPQSQRPIPQSQQPIPQSQQPVPANQSQAAIASPAARKIAREQGLNLHDLKGADPMGRIGKQDLPAKTNGQPGLPVDQENEQRIERVHMSRRRQTIAKHMLNARQSTAMLTTFNEVDMTAILDLRKRHKEAFFQEHQVKLGFMSFFVKAVIGALKAFPLLNAEIDGEYILLKKYYDLGVAVSTDEGLVVPVVHDADRLRFAEIEQAIAELADKARKQKLTLDQLRGGTFTITNGGVFGSLLSTPLLNTPQVGILGMHKIQRRPISLEGDHMENREMMYVALSYDHRIVDGHEAVSFLVKVKEMLEDPESLLLEG